MKPIVKKALKQPVLVFLLLLLTLWWLDSWLGDTNYNPTPVFTHLWLGESFAFICTGIILAIWRKSFSKKLPWFLAAGGALLLSVHILVTHSDLYTHTPDQYANPIGRLYYPLENTIPYTTPFNNWGQDYSLFSDAPEFFKTQVYVLVPLAVGFAYYFLAPDKKPTRK